MKRYPEIIQAVGLAQGGDNESGDVKIVSLPRTFLVYSSCLKCDIKNIQELYHSPSL